MLSDYRATWPVLARLNSIIAIIAPIIGNFILVNTFFGENFLIDIIRDPFNMATNLLVANVLLIIISLNNF